MSNKNELLNLKRRLFALSLAGSCLLSLPACSNGEFYNGMQDYASEDDSQEELTAVVHIFDDYASVMYFYKVQKGNGFYMCAETKEDYDSLDASIYIPVENATVIFPNASFTPEEYVAALKGSNFPIVYLNSKENLSK